MKRGTKPKPTAKKKLQGNPGRRPLPTAEPEFSGTTTPPKWLSNRAKTEWRRLASRLELIGILTPGDRAAFATYCAAYARMVEAENFLASPAAGGSLKYLTSTGALKAWPEIAIANQAADCMRKFLIEFGLTPSSRTRLGVEPPKKESDTEEFIFGGTANDGCGTDPN